MLLNQAELVGATTHSAVWKARVRVGRERERDYKMELLNGENAAETKID